MAAWIPCTWCDIVSAVARDRELDPPRILEREGVRWHLDATEADGLCREILDALPGILQGEIGEEIKENNLRTVIRFESTRAQREDKLGMRSAYVKMYRTPGWREQWKARLFASRAANEWRVMRHCVANGIVTAKPLLYAEPRGATGRDASSYFASEGIEPAKDWIGYFESLGTGSAAARRARRELLVHLGERVRHFHDRRLHHRDLHTNNILVRENRDGGATLFFIDLHSGRIRRMTRTARRKALAKLCHSLRTATSRVDRWRLVRAYFGDARDPARASRQAFAAIERGIDRLEARRLRSRTRRCVVNSTQFRVEATSSHRIYRAAAVSTADLFRAIEHHEALVRSGAELLKNGRTNRLSRATAPWAGEDRAIVVKEFRDRGATDRWKARMGHRRARASWRGSHGLVVRGFRTPALYGLVETRSGTGSQYIVMEAMEPYERLDHYVLRVFGSAPTSRTQIFRKRAFIAAVADLYRDLVAARTYHGDLKATNVLVRERGSDAWDFALLDTDRVVFDRDVSLRRRVKNLAQLYASITTDISLSDRTRFYRHYARDPIEWFHRKRVYRAIEIACRRKRSVVREPIE